MNASNIATMTGKNNNDVSGGETARRTAEENWQQNEEEEVYLVMVIDSWYNCIMRSPSTQVYKIF